MIRQTMFCVAICLLLAGCERQSPTFAKYNLSGGRYFLECEDTRGGSTLNFHSKGEGSTVTEELYDFSWAGSRTLQIENGELSVDGIERGTLQPGDRVLITAAGDVLVNGVKR